MLDIRAVREDPDRFRAGLARRDLAEAVDQLLAADERRRTLTTRVDELRAEQNKASKAIGGAQGEEKQQLIAEVARVSAELKELEPQLADGRRRAQRAARRHAERAARERARRVHRRGRHRGAPPPRAHRVRLRAARPRGARGVAGRPRHRAWCAHERFTVRLPAGRSGVRAVRVDAARDGHPGRQGVRSGDPARARARGSDVRHRHAAGRRGAALLHDPGRPLPRGHG